MSDDEYDNMPDDFADVQGVDWATILAPGPPAAHIQPQGAGPSHQRASIVEVTSISTPPESNNLSSSYFSDDDDMDSAFLAELDRVEQQAISVQAGSAVASTSAAAFAGITRVNAVPVWAQAPHLSVLQAHDVGAEPRTSRHFPIESFPKPKDLDKGIVHEEQTSSEVPCKRRCPDDASCSVSPKRKGKMKVQDDLQAILSTYEDELTCPICCDIFVASHVGNPCGHTFCGECGWQWHIENKNKGCPCCRQTLHKTTPMISNIAMDNTVDKHVKALATSGLREWDVGGRKHQEWTARKEAWRNSADKRNRKKARTVQATPITSVGLFQVFDPPANWFVDDNPEEDPSYEDSDVELIPRPVRRPRRVRRSASGLLEVR